jgi:hypothetical protein
VWLLVIILVSKTNVANKHPECGEIHWISCRLVGADRSLNSNRPDSHMSFAAVS